MIDRVSLARLAAALIALGGSIGTEPVIAENVRKTLRILPMGDSLTAGVGDKTEFGGYRGPLYRALWLDGFDVRMTGSQTIGSFEQPRCEGHPGWTIAQVHQGVTSGWIEEERPDAVLLMIGTNDLFADFAGAPERLAALVDEITRRAPGAWLFVATIPPSGESHLRARIDPYNAAVRALIEARRAAGRAIVAVDVHGRVNVSQMKDKVHPNAAAYALIADEWHRAVRQHFAP